MEKALQLIQSKIKEEKEKQQMYSNDYLLNEIMQLIKQLSTQCKTRQEAYKIGQDINACTSIYLSFFNYRT